MNENLKLRRLGKSDLMVSPIGLGAWQFSKGKGFSGKSWPVLEDEEIINIIDISLKGGINWIDTAEVYGMGESEKAVSRSLKKLDIKETDVIIATKWLPMFLKSKSIIKTIDKRLECLDGYSIDLYQIHFPIPTANIKSQMRAMSILVKEKKIRYIGVSNFSADKMTEVSNELSKYDLNLISNQVKYSILNRKIETNGIMETAKESGISIIAYSPLAQGLVTGKFHDNPNMIKQRPGFRKYQVAFKQKGLEKSKPVIDALKEISNKHNATPSQVALNWLIQFSGDIVVAIPGATKSSHAADNVGTLNFELNNDELDYLDRISAPFKN